MNGRNQAPFADSVDTNALFTSFIVKPFCTGLSHPSFFRSITSQKFFPKTVFGSKKSRRQYIVRTKVRNSVKDER